MCQAVCTLGRYHEMPHLFLFPALRGQQCSPDFTAGTTETHRDYVMQAQMAKRWQSRPFWVFLGLSDFPAHLLASEPLTVWLTWCLRISRVPGRDPTKLVHQEHHSSNIAVKDWPSSHTSTHAHLRARAPGVATEEALP